MVKSTLNKSTLNNSDDTVFMGDVHSGYSLDTRIADAGIYSNTYFAKKSQSELLGFVFVIGILSIGLLVVLAFMLSAPSESSSYKDKKALSYLIQSSTQFTTTCANGMRFGSVILDCAAGLNQQICENKTLNQSSTAFEDKDSQGNLLYVDANPTQIGTCAYMTQTLNELVKKTLVPWASRYELVVEYIPVTDTTKQTLYKAKNGQCSTKIPSQPYTLADYSQGSLKGQVLIQAFVCD
jgi:hypothetical protein